MPHSSVRQSVRAFRESLLDLSWRVFFASPVASLLASGGFFLISGKTIDVSRLVFEKNNKNGTPLSELRKIGLDLLLQMSGETVGDTGIRPMSILVDFSEIDGKIDHHFPSTLHRFAELKTQIIISVFFTSPVSLTLPLARNFQFPENSWQ